MSLATKRFVVADQERFATLSGDRNPIHMDATSARRSPFGLCVVHGLHLVLWSLDELCRHGVIDQAWPSIKVDFAHPCLVGDEATIVLSGKTGGGLQCQVRLGSAVITSISLAAKMPTLAGEDVSNLSPEQNDLPMAARALSVEAIEGDRGCYRLPSSQVADAFPDATRVFGAPAICGLAALSTVVGMLNPGLYSLFSSFTAVFVDDFGGKVAYRADRFSQAVRQTTLRVRAYGVDATVRAGARPPPTQQLSAVDARTLVSAEQFKDRRPLIVGGSRGLGEVTAKLLAAGGARPLITYVAGRGEAESVAAEILDSGGRCDVLRYDVRDPPGPQLNNFEGDITGMYFFATTPIFRVRTSFLDVRLIDEFMGLYVIAFSRLAEFVAQNYPGVLRLFYPSSVAVDEPKDIPEYAASKAAGEVICANLALQYSNIRVEVSRLPRIATDQTSTMMPIKSASAVETMLPLITGLERR